MLCDKAFEAMIPVDDCNFIAHRFVLIFTVSCSMIDECLALKYNTLHVFLASVLELNKPCYRESCNAEARRAEAPKF